MPSCHWKVMTAHCTYILQLLAYCFLEHDIQNESEGNLRPETKEVLFHESRPTDTTEIITTTEREPSKEKNNKQKKKKTKKKKTKKKTK